MNVWLATHSDEKIGDLRSDGVLTDAMQWMARQVEQQFDSRTDSMRTRLKLGSRRGPVQLAGGRELALDDAVDRTEAFRFVYVRSITWMRPSLENALSAFGRARRMVASPGEQQAVVCWSGPAGRQVNSALEGLR